MVSFKDISVKTVKENEYEGTYEVAPLPRGYGHTLVNSLRRALLSSIKGAGITSIKIAGIEHEYSTLKGVKEDVLEIILNLKALRFKMLTDEPQVCYIEVKGEKNVTAADIKAPGGVEIVSKDLEIATLTSKDASLNIEIVVEGGYGYKEAEEGDRSELGRIPLDTDFTPIKNVKFDVVSARKGQATDLDGVNIEIVTDGTVAPKQALLDSAKILQDFSGKVMVALGVSSLEVEQLADQSMKIEEVAQESEGPTDEVSSWKVEDLPISKRSKSGLLSGGYQTVGDLSKTSINDLLALQGFGNKSLNEVVDLMKQYGIELK